MSETVLRALLSEGRALGAEYGDGLSSHLPMALIALERLGADEERLESFAAHYSKRLRQKAPASRTLGTTDWESVLGKHVCEAELNAYFGSQLAARGADETLRCHLPALIPGVAGAAFHGLIRLAYALDADDKAEIVEGLTAWTMAYLPLPTATLPPRFATCTEALKALHEDRAFNGLKWAAPNIFSRIAAVAANPGFVPYLSCLPYETMTLAALAEGALAIYAANGNFTSLHMVTACHAMRLVSPWLEDQGAALRHLWTGILAAYVTVDRPPPATNITNEKLSMALPSWEEIAEKATQSRDDHVIKLVYTCREEQQAYGWAAYRAFAAIKAGFTIG